jgi:hypothetical protein
MKSISTLQKLAWIYAAMFLFTVLISHVPSFNDNQGLLFGLYHVSPLIDAVHLFSGLLGVAAALASARWSIRYFKTVGVIFWLDALVSLLLSRDILETFSLFTKGAGGTNLTITNLLANSPHIILASIALWIGFRYSKQAPKSNANK